MDGLRASWLNLDDAVVFIPTACPTKLRPVSRDIYSAAWCKASLLNHVTWVRTRERRRQKKMSNVLYVYHKFKNNIMSNCKISKVCIYF